MPVFTIETPSGKKITIEAPDEQTAIRGAKEYEEGQGKQQKMSMGEDVLRSGATGLREGVEGTLGIVGDAARTQGDVLSWAAKQLGAGEGGQKLAWNAGRWLHPGAFMAGSDDIRQLTDPAVKALDATDILAHKPETRAGKYARTIGQYAPAAASPGSLGRKAASVVVPAVLSETAGQLTEGSKLEPWARLGGGLAGGLAVSGIGRSGKISAPTVEQLKQQADDLYAEAERNGLTATRGQTKFLSAAMKKLATDEGLISPTGRVSEAYPKAKEALRLFDDYAAGEMSVRQMKAVRKVLTDAAKSVDDSERRIATLMLDQFDNFTSRLAPELKQARSFYHMAKKGEELATLDELAASRAGQFTGSGMENARRTEYRGLERGIIKGTERGWTPEEQAAISRVAQGTPLSNAFRNVGRMAPTGPVSFSTTVGVPYAIGHTIGGPALGTLLAGSAAGIGYGARGLANRMGRQAAEQASALARGGKIPASQIDQATLLRLLAAAATSANSANRYSKERERQRREGKPR